MPAAPPDILPWVLAGVSTVVASLSGAIVAVYHGRIADLKERIQRQDADLKERLKRQDEQIDELLRDLAPRVRRIEGDRGGR